MKFSLMTAIILSVVATTAASAAEAKQQASDKVEFSTTKQYLAQPSIKTSQAKSVQDIEPAAGAVTSIKNPLLERKFQNYKR